MGSTLPVTLFTLSLCYLAIFSFTFAVLPHKKFEYKFSFKGPHLIQRDGSIPFWDHGGHAIPSDDSIRITPSLRSKKGYVWSKNVVTFDNWEVEITFKVSGRGRIGADGLAFWYSRQKGVEGPVFGSNDKWDGLAVFFDSFDNDGQHNNPYIIAMVNDGTLSYDHSTDGATQQLGGCMRDFRNKPFPIRFKIEYYQKTLTMFINNGLNNSEKQFEMCMRAENVELPKNGYFGISGATGGLADDHDVLALLTHSLQPRTDGPDQQPQVSEDERRKYEQEFDEYHRKLQQAKEDYRREHPDATAEDVDRIYGFQDQGSQELRMIFEGQSFMHETIRTLHTKLDEVIGRQERTMSQITSLQGGQVGVAQGQQPQGGMVGGGDGFKRFEVDQVLSIQLELQQSLRDVRTYVNDVQAKIIQIQQAQKQPVQGGGAPQVGYDVTKGQNEIKDMMHNLQNDLRTIAAKQTQVPGNCPPPGDSACVTTTYFIVLIILQLLIFVVYVTYKSSKEAAAKKFY